MPTALRRLGPERLAGLVFVVLLHAAVLQALWSARMLPLPATLAPVFVDFIVPPAPPAPPPEPARPVRLEKPRSLTPPQPSAPPPPQLAAESTPVRAGDAVAPRPEPVIAGPAAPAAPAPAPVAAGPVRLSEELSLACPSRTPPLYPAHLRRRGVEGQVSVRVELDEQGGVAEARIDHSSGSDALDAAALAAVRQWRCQPAQRGGRPVRAVALQAFNFTLEGH